MSFVIFKGTSEEKTIRSLVLYNNVDESFVVQLPHYTSACKSWTASTSGLDRDTYDKVGTLAAEYEQLEKLLHACKTQLDKEEDPEKIKELGELFAGYQKRSLELGVQASTLSRSASLVYGLNKEQLATADESRKVYTDMRDELIGLISNGLMAEDRTTKACTNDELQKLRSREKELLIYSVAMDPENNIPTSFLAQLGEMIPSLNELEMSKPESIEK